MTSQKYSGIFYDNFDVPMTKVKASKSAPKKKPIKSIRIKKKLPRSASDLNIGVVNYDK